MAKNTKAPSVELELNLSISKEDFEVFSSVSDSQVNEYVSNCVLNYLSAYAKGGLMLSGDDVRDISVALGEDVSSSRDIVNAIKNPPVDQSESSGDFRIKVDPSLVDNIKGSADVLGITVEQWMNNCWGHIIANGWLYGISADIRWVPFPLGRIKEIEKAYGKPLDSSSSICEALSAGVKA